MITVIIPTYKRANYIDRAIRSVMNQTYQDFELIIVDDNDPDTEDRRELEKRMQKYKQEKRIKYIQHEKNKNGAAARNTGIEIAKGDYITFLDDDDYFMPSRLEILKNELERNREYGGAYTSSIVTRKKKIIGGESAKKSGNMQEELLLNEFSFTTGSNLFFRASVLNELGGFDVKFQRHQDIEIMIRFFRNNKILAIDKPLVVKVQDDRNNVPNIEKYIKIKELYFKTFEKDIAKLNEEKIKLFYMINYQQLVETAIRGKQYGKVKELKKMMREHSKIPYYMTKRRILLYINNYLKIENIKYWKLRRDIKSKYKDETNYIRKMEE